MTNLTDNMSKRNVRIKHIDKINVLKGHEILPKERNHMIKWMKIVFDKVDLQWKSMFIAIYIMD